MNRSARVWLTTATGLAVLWLGVALFGWLSTGWETTPQTILAQIGADPLEDAADRDANLRGLADAVNRLPGAARMDPELGEALRGEFEAMTPEERSLYLDLTLPRGFEELMLAFNAMEGAERRRIVGEATARMDEEMARAGGKPPEGLDEGQLQRVVDEGMKSFLSDASAETKLDLQPLVHRMQGVMQGLR
ncbi:hypothetical protein [Phycisphaera mikurensis]|uniref:Uncharacterized protein n=1 Tax=Phycisphaera mikurensis (strain NBRC 102666 / KCTC 22515 / FYK2301M01) TaxID=1142394 RepID=I0IES4_PHYMF|nr:hypothetical protein [Phycisphaera mikurensis]MBB6441557.1 hypothetical protein [Phycisphaera mikurensis]BAM03762.1 hypothetical protein PSMK_16030 [Phycisphaera mikurensis NBRC 102666]